MKLGEVLSKETKWCKGAAAKDSHGYPVKCNSQQAEVMCLMGAMSKCCNLADPLHCVGTEIYNKVHARVEAYLLENHDVYDYDKIKGGPVTFFNDHPKTQWADVKNLIKGL